MKSALTTIFLIASLLVLNSAGFLPLKTSQDPLVDGFRPPAVPLIVFDPYMSIWSMADNLYDDFPKLWCGTIKALTGIIRVDGKSYRFMGPAPSNPVNDVIPQKSVRVQPTQTLYTFQNDKITFEVTFSTPTIPTDLDLLSQPVTYITFKVSSNDGQTHQVEVYYDQTAEIAVHSTDQVVAWSRPASKNGGPKYVMSMGTTDQKVCVRNGDGVGIDWGYAYLTVDPVDESDDVRTVIANSTVVRNQFAQSGTIPSQDENTYPRPASDNWPVMAVMWSFKVSPGQKQSRFLTFAYDDIYSIDYFGTKLPAYWKRDGKTASAMLADATQSYTQRLALLDEFDKNHLANLTAAADSKYATVASLIFRQAFGGCKLVWNQNTSTPWYFMKEISSDGNLHTADVIFPASPIFLYTNPYLLELMMVPLLAYANNETNVQYNLPWAPHDLGEWPIAFRAPNQQEQMPVEETGNMLQMITALTKLSAQQQQSYDSLIFPKYKNLIESWAVYLTSGDGVLPNPGDQLCTDDFLGPIPQNVNLALKGIVALGNYVEACKIKGDYVCAVKYDLYTKNYTAYWLQNANDSTDGVHAKRQYDLSNTWSLKYNLLYQYIVGTTTFPTSVIENELAFYIGKQLNTYGIPLDNKATFTKLDWEAWIAAMAPNPADRTEIFERIYKFANETPQRVPLTDWYDTVQGTQKGFQARTVLGGLYAWMLLQPTSKTTIIA